ncbi:hypothetical protein Aph01nite_42030 [Acrocarpospora phusangensis]|uniref:CBM2 domain-containing protein n=1 Tax=Acrocarpospora phusangensis TaxID=1070424 RepID=A0A919UPZ9_9ACTN|nr:cellulose binding domain-containing protein [Acrocarpospora phusangensis]GIH25893.1 hypothetical protein Aph01nite_42030 [Acrocarpospora phusangensis]
MRSLKTTIARMAAVALAIPLFVSAGPPAATANSAAYGCAVTYDTTDWTTGFVVALTVSNTGTIPFSPWILQFVFSGNQTVTAGWSGVWTQTPPSVQFTNPTWFASIAPGASHGLGFTATYTGVNANPTGVTLNGVPCVVTFL